MVEALTPQQVRTLRLMARMGVGRATQSLEEARVLLRNGDPGSIKNLEQSIEDMPALLLFLDEAVEQGMGVSLFPADNTESSLRGSPSARNIFSIEKWQSELEAVPIDPETVKAYYASGTQLSNISALHQAPPCWATQVIVTEGEIPLI